MINLLITCPICGATYEVAVPADGYMAWQNGELIQNAMPTLSADERECLISGLCLDCQNDIFG